MSVDLKPPYFQTFFEDLLLFGPNCSPSSAGATEWSRYQKTRFLCRLGEKSKISLFGIFDHLLKPITKISIFEKRKMAEFAMCVSYSKLGQKWSKSSKILRFWKLRKNAVFSRIDHFRSPRTRGSSSNWKKMDFWKMKKWQFVHNFSEKARIDLQGPMVLETPPRCQKTPLGMYMWGKIEHFTFVHFWLIFELDSPKWNFEILEKKCL